MKWLSGIVLFLLGFGIAWVARPEKVVKETVTIRGPAARTEKQRERKIDPKVAGYLDGLMAIDQDEAEKQRAFLAAAEKDQLPNLVKTFAKRAGIAGLSSVEQKIFNELLKKVA